MRALVNRVVLVSVLAVILDPAGAQARSRPTRWANLEFRLVFDKQEYKPAEPIHARFSLTNNGRKPIWINKRFYLSSSEVPKRQREVFLTVTSPSGKPLSCKQTYETGFPKSDEFVLVQPGQEVTSEQPRDLRGYCEFQERGTYTIVGVYENVFGKEIGLPAFRGPFQSQPVSITIVE